MFRLFLITALIAALASVVAAQGSNVVGKLDRPAGWGLTGSNYEGYDFTVDTKVKHGGKASAMVKPKATAEAGKFGSIVQSIRADNYRGKRIKLSGYMKTQDVENAQFWLRVDGIMEQLDFSNMEDRPVKGNTDWTKYELVVDVPQNAEEILLGAFLVGSKGQMWVDDMKLEAVSNDVAKTSNKITDEERAQMKKYLEDFMKKASKEELDKMEASRRSRPLEATNLDFEAAQTPANPTNKSK